MCDVYVYEDCGGGWTTHVAGNRLTKKAPELPSIETCTQEEWAAAYRRQGEWLDKEAVHESIGLPEDGNTFNDPTPGACADRLEELRDMGYNVPQYAIDALREEDEEHEG
jgi:hypothetical protein